MDFVPIPLVAGLVGVAVLCVLGATWVRRRLTRSLERSFVIKSAFLVWLVLSMLLAGWFLAPTACRGVLQIVYLICVPVLLPIGTHLIMRGWRETRVAANWQNQWKPR